MGGDFIKTLIDKLYIENDLSLEELEILLENLDENMRDYLIEKAYIVRKKNYGDDVFFRGLLEISNICKCNCFYCGIRAENKKVERYYLDVEEIIKRSQYGYELGYRTFVLQGGENSIYSDDKLEYIIKTLKEKYSDIAITLSLGERDYNSLERLYKAGADRYLLRHETINKELYQRLHPGMSYENRIDTLMNLKKIGYQVGTGFLIGLPTLSLKDYAKDLVFIKRLNPHMVGIGPFIPQKDTPLKDEVGGNSYDTITLLAILRLLIPDLLLPATTALVTIDENGREKAFKAGANVIMPNLSPIECRKLYSLYDGKKISGDESAEEKKNIEIKIKESGFIPQFKKGDNLRWKRR